MLCDKVKHRFDGKEGQKFATMVRKIIFCNIIVCYYVSILKKKLFWQIRPPANSVYGIHNPKGIAYLAQLWIRLSKLNLHKFKHNFKDTVNPMCSINDDIEDTEHFLLLCNSFTEHRYNLLAGVNGVLEAYGYSEAPENNILQLLLYGSKHLPLEANRLILNATMNYIFETERFD